MLLSYCVVNTGGRELLLACLEAIERTAPTGVQREVLVLDNASEDGSVEAVRSLGREVRLLALERRTGKAENDSTLLREARGRYCLLLNEDAELLDGAPAALLDALEADPGAAIASAQLLAPDGSPQPCAWRLPGLSTALAGALFLHRPLVVQSRGGATRPVGWAQSSAMLVRREAAQRVGWLDPDFFVYSDETDFCKRLADAGWRTLYVPDARALHHHQLGTDVAGGDRRIVEFHRNRDLYLRKHNGPAVAFALRPLLAFPYLVRAVGALFLPGHSPRRYWAHAHQALLPRSGEGIREAAEEFNRTRRGRPPLDSHGAAGDDQSVNQERKGAWGRAWLRTRAAFDHFTGLPGVLQLCGVAAIALVLGSLTPWFTFGGPDEFSDQYALGVEGTVGELTLLIGVTAIALIARLIRRRQDADSSGGLAALGLLALALTAAEVIHTRDSGFGTVAWGLYASGAAAALLLLSGFLLLGRTEEPAPPD